MYRVEAAVRSEGGAYARNEPERTCGSASDQRRAPMARISSERADRVDRWTERVDQLCRDGETVEHRVDLASATVAVTSHRVLAFTPDADGPNFRHVERPNVGTVTLETTNRLGLLCWALVAAFVGVALLETATAADFTALVPGVDPPATGSLPGAGRVAQLAEGALGAVETALLVVEWGVLAIGGIAIVLAAVLVGAYIRSRSQRLVLRVSGDEDLVLSVGDAEFGADDVTELEAAIRPGSASETELEPTPAREGTSDGRGERRADDRRGPEESA